MAFYHWDTCTNETRRQVQNLLEVLQKTEGKNLVGLYLHGSLALGCFDPERSDLDLLGVTRQKLEMEARKTLFNALLRLSGTPHPMEISLLCLDDLRPWRHPTPFDLHYSEAWRQRIQDDLAGEGWKTWGHSGQLDSDLAAHITILHRSGVCLYGTEIGEVFPPIPPTDYAASLLEEVEWEMERWQQDPLNALLSLVRVLAYLKDGLVLSKKEGGDWALKALPAYMQASVWQILAVYQRGAEPSSINMEALGRTLLYLNGEIALRANLGKHLPGEG